MDVVVRCICREPYNDGNLVQCEKCGHWQHKMCVGSSPGPCFKCSRDEERNKLRTRKRPVGEGVPAALMGKRRASGIVDHPQCFYNEISANEFASGAFGRDLAKDEAPASFGIEIRRVSHAYSIAAFGIYTLGSVGRGEYCAEVIGQVDWVANYKASTYNQYKLMGCPKPGVLFFENMAVDCRVRGNYGAFVQHSARPNCRVAAINQDGTVRFLLQALQDLQPGVLLTVAWQWDAGHPIHRPLHMLTPAQSAAVDKSVSRLREFGLGGTVNDFLPDQRPEPELRRLEGVRGRDPSRKGVEVEAGSTTGKDTKILEPTLGTPSGAPSGTPSDTPLSAHLGAPISQFVWNTPQLVPAEEAPKKRLSLADYKKKRPVTEGS